VPLGYWEAKDEDDDLDEEIEKKFRKGYPQDNIAIFPLGVRPCRRKWNRRIHHEP
jgi:hypothetical protein